jgi:hypothetical protein
MPRNVPEALVAFVELAGLVGAFEELVDVDCMDAQRCAAACMNQAFGRERSRRLKRKLEIERSALSEFSARLRRDLCHLVAAASSVSLARAK